MIYKIRSEKGIPDPDDKEMSPVKIDSGEDELAKLETAKNAMEKKVRD